MKKTAIIIGIVICIFALVSCHQKSENIVEQIEINGILVHLDCTKLDMSDSDINDVSPFYQLNNLQELNLSENDISPDDIMDLKSKLPQCDILWSVPIGNNLYPSDSINLNLKDTNLDEVNNLSEILSCFDNLMSVSLDSSNISTSKLNELKQSNENITFDVNIFIDKTEYNSNENILDLSAYINVDTDKIIDALGYFSSLSSINFGQIFLTDIQKDELLIQFPDTELIWSTSLFGLPISSDIAELDISNQKVTNYEDFKHSLKYLPQLKHIDMCGCRLSNEQMENLQAAYPDTKFVWIVKVGSWKIRTDIKAFSTGTRGKFEGGEYTGNHPFLSNEQVNNLKYCTDLIALDIGHQKAITDFSFLENLNNIQYLIIAMTGIEDINCISHMKNLMYLEIFTNNISELSPLLELPNLKHLNCSTSQFTDNSVLIELTQLERLWIVDSLLSQEEIDELYTALPDTTIVHIARSPTHSGWRAKGCQIYIDMQELFGLNPLFSGD